MREIKYKVYIQDEGVYEVKDIDFYNKKITYLLTDNFDGGYLCAECGFKYATLLQYTGLKDKNGVEIYEGDIVKHFGDEILLVKWINDRGKYYCLSKYGLENNMLMGAKLSNQSVEYMEVIGNIYENPELLKQ